VGNTSIQSVLSGDVCPRLQEVPERRQVYDTVVDGAGEEDSIYELGDLNRQQGSGGSLEVLGSVEREEGADDVGNVGGFEDVGKGGVVGDRVDKAGSSVVAGNENRGGAVAVVDDGETAGERREEVEGGRKGMLKVLNQSMRRRR